MNISQHIAKTIEQTHSLARIVDAALDIVQREMRCGGCSVFLLDRDDEPTLRAGFREGPADWDTFAPEVAGQMAADAVSSKVSKTREESGRSLLAAPMLLRGRAVGAIVVERAGGHVFSAEETEMLESASAQLVGVVVNARLIEALDRYDDPLRLLLGPSPNRPERLRGETVVQGTAACPGIAIGVVAFRGVHELSVEVRAIPSQGKNAEKARLSGALVKTRNDIIRLQSAAAREIDEEHALIFNSHLLLTNDPNLLDRLDRAIDSGVSAPVAIDDALGQLEKLLGAVPDAYLQERVEDIDDLRGRLLSHVLDAGGRPKHEGMVLLTRRIPPSLVVELKAEGAHGIVTEIGGITSHGALLARALGIPAVTGVTDVLDKVSIGDTVIVDGEAGKVILRPEPQTLAVYRERHLQAERLRTEYAKYRDRPLMTADGVRVGMLANIAVASDLTIARENGAEGVGLYRTEFPFIIREQFPTREEQVRIYRRAYDSFPEGPIHFRVLDLGGDKFLASSSVATARSPFHGYRGIRVLFDHPQILQSQVQAFALAAAGRPLSILIPMVTSMEELRRMKKLIAEALDLLPEGKPERPPSLGVMIEAPGAVEIAAELAKEADYLSIGTNDLVQYALVVDREDARLSSPRDAYHPAILRMVRRAVMAAHAAGKPVSVCGEMAVRSDLAALLVVLGVDALSVVPRGIPALKQEFASLEIGRLAVAIDNVLASPDAETLEAALSEHLR